MWATISLVLVVIVSCNEPTEVSVFAPVDTVIVMKTDTLILTVTDTLIKIVTDTVFVPVPADRIYCWLTDENKGHTDPPQFACDDGYMGPRI